VIVKIHSILHFCSNLQFVFTNFKKVFSLNSQDKEIVKLWLFGTMFTSTNFNFWTIFLLSLL